MEAKKEFLVELVFDKTKENEELLAEIRAKLNELIANSNSPAMREMLESVRDHRMGALHDLVSADKIEWEEGVPEQP